jgi:phytoene dehydrogenase-like protein
MQAMQVFDVAVVGAGFGGLGAALALAEQGARVVLCEALRYPGGCASTFARAGHRFESGATLLSGFGESQLFGAWNARFREPVTLTHADTLVEFRSPQHRIRIGAEREALIEQFVAAGAPVGLREFFLYQREVADTLWSVLDRTDDLPPFDGASLLRHLGRVEAYLPLLNILGQRFSKILARFGLTNFAPLTTYLDAVCQITVQCSSREAEAAFVLAALDYYFRGAAHVNGGVGAWADAIVRQIQWLGGEVMFSNVVRRITPTPEGGYALETRHGPIAARAVVANVLPEALMQIAPSLSRKQQRTLESLQREVDDGWGAAMLYMVAKTPPGASSHAHHLQLVDDVNQAYQDGNHVFVSISDANETERTPSGDRTLTVSTHVSLQAMRKARDTGAFIADIQQRMRRTIDHRAPEWAAQVISSMTASPRTFARFVGRPGGAVGGVPRRAGLGNYRRLGPFEAAPRLWMVGDSTFPGQSALACATGGVRTAAAVRRALELRALPAPSSSRVVIAGAERSCAE